jgi:hypothetical protein
VILLLTLLGCVHEIPPHLQVDRTAVQSSAGAAVGLEALVRMDPLVRRPPPRGPGDWISLPDGAALEAWADQARSSSISPADWINLERNHPGTAAVALARGARLAALEVVLAGELDDATQQQVAAWLGVTRVEVQPTTHQRRAPLDWLPGATDADKKSAALVMAERGVLLGWLDGPDIQVGPAARALAAHNRLMDTPTGALLLSRARMDRSSDSAQFGRAALLGATTLALAAAAADRDSEQEALQAKLAEASAKLGGKADPIGVLLERARIALTADAGDTASAGLALTAITAQRLHGSCPEQRCEGLDRTQTLATVMRWSTESAAVARAWQVVALKQAADTFEASHDKPSFGTTLLDVVDPLSGFGGGSVELSLLRYRTAEPTAVLQISRLAGHPSTTDPDETLKAIRARLIEACNAALKGRLPRGVAAEIRRIRDRARRA